LPENISANELLAELLAHREIRAEQLMAAAHAPDFFRIVVEGLADRFDWDAVNVYAGMFAFVISRVFPDFKLGALVNRYTKVREPKHFEGPSPDDVFVLSRVTLGADVAITSVVLDAMKRRFPNAAIWLVGSRKNWELFEVDGRVRHLDAPYKRTGTLEERLAASRALAGLIGREGMVIDVDSRLTQLGLMPICPVKNYFYFDTRSPEEPGSLSELTARWLEKTFDIDNPKPFVAPAPHATSAAHVTISLGTGENPAKRIQDPFERMLLDLLNNLGGAVIVDKGAGGEETARVNNAVAGFKNVRGLEGAFASFAAHIVKSDLYVGYDSAGQHVAAACGVPLITIFAGYPNNRFLERWRPTGPGRIDVIPADNINPDSLITRVAGLIE
jgi:ADP-heptose:LPS heptosyltransferase